MVFSISLHEPSGQCSQESIIEGQLNSLVPSNTNLVTLSRKQMFIALGQKIISQAGLQAPFPSQTHFCQLLHPQRKLPSQTLKGR